MNSLSDIPRWISENEAFLSGTAAIVTFVGVFVSGLALAFRRLLVRGKTAAAPPSAATPSTTAALTDGAAGVAEEGGPVVAALAFDNLSSDPEMQFFSDGVSEEIIQRLSRGARLRVIGRASSFQFRGERKAEAAGRLRCSHVLDGSVRRAAESVRVSAHLVEASSQTTLWSDRYDRKIEDIFAVQDEISGNIARVLHQQFAAVPDRAIDPAAYDLYLRSSPKSYAPDELRAHIGVLEAVPARVPEFADAWGRLAYLRAFLRFYQPFRERPASGALIERQAARALALDPENVDALAEQLFVLPPFGRFIEADRLLESLRQAYGSGDGRRYIGWYLRTMGWIRASLEDTEKAYRLDSLDPMSANLLALARMAAGRVAEAIPVYEDLVERVPDMSFPVASLLRAHTFQQDWPAIDRLLALAGQRQLREFESTPPFIRAKRAPTPENLGAWRTDLEAQARSTGRIDVSRLVHSAHLGFVDEAYRLADESRLGPAGDGNDIMGPDAYRTSLLFQAGMPELRNDPRFPRLCARLGLVELWMTTGKWPDCAASHRSPNSWARSTLPTRPGAWVSACVALSRLLNGATGISPEMALRLAKKQFRGKVRPIGQRDRAAA